MQHFPRQSPYAAFTSEIHFSVLVGLINFSLFGILQFHNLPENSSNSNLASRILFRIYSLRFSALSLVLINFIIGYKRKKTAGLNKQKVSVSTTVFTHDFF